MKHIAKHLFQTILLTVFVFNCSADDEPTDEPLPLSTINLEFDLTTNQDQMGDFANNAMAVFNDKVWSFGGSNDYVAEGDSTDALWNSSNGTNWATTDTGGTLTASGRHEHTLSVFNGKMYLIGGSDNAGTVLSDIWVTDDGITWSRLMEFAPFGQVSGHSTLVFNGKMYVIGINYTTGNTKIWSTSNAVDWIEENANAFPALKRYKAIVKNNAMYVIGGDKVTSELTNDIWRSSNGINWSLVTQTSPILPAIKRHTVTVFNNKAFVIGGHTSSSEHTNTIYYSTDMENWFVYTDSNPLEEINSHAALTYQSDLWVFGGSRGTPGRTGKIWRIMEF
ncbi:Kelch motif-containing protein [Bizionia echini]|uniref:Kelch motif-containing protein n=1 Tax=Bizionia echini TaxID=649333 RepID=A0A1I5DK31_9FLAO|nr:kelch repeat-containing protein [Bizionia echini]SFN99614.1 Kelch motif-containing protein [Bizionia echini]